MLSLLCILYLLSPSLVPCPGCVCACVCACLCVCNLVFSSDSHLSAHRSSGSRPASTCQLLCSSVLPHRARGSVSLCLSVSLPPSPCVCRHFVRLPAFWLDALFALGQSAYAVPPSLCQCFTGCQSFSLSVSCFVSFWIRLILYPVYMHVCV